MKIAAAQMEPLSQEHGEGETLPRSSANRPECPGQSESLRTSLSRAARGDATVTSSAGSNPTEVSNSSRSTSKYENVQYSR